MGWWVGGSAGAWVCMRSNMAKIGTITILSHKFLDMPIRLGSACNNRGGVDFFPEKLPYCPQPLVFFPVNNANGSGQWLTRVILCCLLLSYRCYCISVLKLISARKRCNLSGAYISMSGF